MNKEDLKQIKEVVEKTVDSRMKEVIKNFAKKQETENMIKESTKNLATKDYVKEAVKNLATKDYVKEAVKNLATKQELKNLENKLESRIERLEDSMLDLRITVDKRLNSLEDKVEKGVNKMITFADEIAKKFSLWQDENTINTGIEAYQDKQLENHENRINKLEELQIK